MESEAWDALSAGASAIALWGLPSPADPPPIEGVFDWLAARDAFTVVQIGAYIGSDTENDPLYDFRRITLPGHPASVAILVE